MEGLLKGYGKGFGRAVERVWKGREGKGGREGVVVSSIVPERK